ncbi:MAG: phenylalanine--tRNA ligase subunit beta [Zoogloea oleivorans]|jgi:phenylalanyl-tRNA synthetase beta chain|uniref:phenylalanine--tRNA ligase subunit beta n=1 Tax=Zoogloea oleivorans TaxID=1552750 RepID=UPI002A36B2F9|nr:phenylalanine--tRNA ligase subunit beta [Zoogloea oleivorans]MDY0034953.1 phenylalanine--tRNA ligase subunit beta [Zoogloea oleivorans]
MQFSELWLRSFVSPALDSDALGHLLTMAGLEVEEQDGVAAVFSKVVVAQIVEAEKHPNADKLRVCKVDAGQGELLQIVCGAPNAAAGLKIPCALVGADLAGFGIKAAKLRGVESFGMLCSAKELGTSDESSGLLVLPEDAPIGMDVREYLSLDDTLFTIKLTPNRADCLSLTGIAREVAALTASPLTLPACEPVAAAHADVRAIVLDAPEACPRYSGRIIRGVNAKAPTPEWMKQRLARSGIRSISALVDVTNYVMLELGQPLHAFDNAKLNGAIHVRLPNPGEQVLLLNGQTITPAADTLLIADETRALALAGVMGGEDSGITLDTTDLFLESAFFAPDAIAGRARAYGFSSDASYRFERGVDFALAGQAMERATRLILDICGGSAGPVQEALAADKLPARAPIRLRAARVRRVLGIALTADCVAEMFERLNLTVARDGEDFVVTPPSYRFDLEIEEDLIEEIARLHGYDNIPSVPPRGPISMLPRPEAKRDTMFIRRLVAGREYQEVINFAFVDEAWEKDFCGNADPVRLANPIASQMSVMRSSLIGGLVANVVTNRKRQTNRVRVFEIGRCFARDAAGKPVDGFHQPVRLAALAAGFVRPEQWAETSRNVDFFDVKADLEALLFPRVAEFERAAHPALHPGRSARVLLDGRAIGFIGELHPVWVQRHELGTAPVLFEIELDVLLDTVTPAYQELSRFPAVTRDLALVVDQDAAAAILLKGLQAVAPAIVQRIELFDQYQGKGVEPNRKSLAFRVVMQETQRTLEDVEVDAAMAALTRHAEENLGAKLRA